jgi:hypothetical protein
MEYSPFSVSLAPKAISCPPLVPPYVVNAGAALAVTPPRTITTPAITKNH